MDESPSSPAPRGAADLQLDADIGAVLRERLPAVAAQTVAAVTEEVPSYAGGFSGTMGDNIEAAVQMALAGFLTLASGSRDSDPSTPHGPTLEGAYALGRGEARSGRSMDALLSAYRVGARVAWREMADAATKAGVAASTMARFAELVFAYIDELSAASVAGHGDEMATTGRVRERYLERLAALLLEGEEVTVLEAAAERAAWEPPQTLTAVLLPQHHAPAVLSHLGPHTLHVSGELPGVDDDSLSVILVPDSLGPGRVRLIRLLDQRRAVLGPARPWTEVRRSYERALRAHTLPRAADVLDTETRLSELVLTADRQALADLRAAVLAPLDGLKPGPRARLEETLRAWLLHHGRRDQVAAELHVHPQTVRYRMGQVRQAFGDALDDPGVVLELTIALAFPPAPEGG